MRPSVMTPKQALQWCEQELAKHERQVHQAELDYATDQYQTATQTGDTDRAYFWLAVRDRVRRGESLNDAMNAEHRTHNGPFKLEEFYGGWHTVYDLDYWRQ